MKKLLLVALAIISIGMLIWLADFNEVYTLIASIKPSYIIIGCLMQLITILLINFQWYTLGKKVEVELAFSRVLYMNMIGTFVESVTPSVKAGGEATKVYYLNKKLEVDMGKATAMVGLQKTISILAFLIINAIALSWFLLNVNIDVMPVTTLFIAFGSLIVFTTLIFLLLKYTDKISFIIYKLTKGRLDYRNGKGINSFRETIGRALRDKKTFAIQLALALIIWLFFAVKAIYLARGLNLNISYSSVAVATYLTYMVAMVPLLPGGLGTFEGSMLIFLQPFNVPASGAMAFALALRFVTFWFVVLLSGIYVVASGLYQLLNGRLKNLSLNN